MEWTAGTTCIPSTGMSAIPSEGFRSRRRFCLVPLILWMAGGASAQTATLSLSSASVAAGGTAVLTLALDASAGVAPAAIQWTLQFPASAIGSVTVEDGPVPAAAGKTIICKSDAPAYTCLAAGLNAETMADGVVAFVTALLPPGVSEAVILVNDALGVSAGGDPIPITAAAGTVTIAARAPEVRRLRPAARQRGR